MAALPTSKRVAAMPAIANLIDPANPAAWLLASLGIAVLASNAAWLLLGQRGRNALVHSQTGALAALTWLAAAAFMLIPPLLAWERGVLSPYYLGVTEPQWLVIVSVGLPVAVILVSLFLFGWLVYRRSLEPAGAGGEPPAGVERLLHAIKAPLDAGLCQWHWAFYRGLAIGWLAVIPLDVVTGPTLARLLESMQAQPLYWGSWLGLGWAGLEWALNPFARAALRSDAARESALRRIALAVATTALFTLTRDFWLCLACHVAVETAIAAFFPLPAARPTAG
jgi:hypothetical protein